jgi:hypothetical protein
VAEVVGAAPHRPERAQPRGVPERQRLEAGVDRLGALQMQDGRGRPIVVAGRIELGDGADDADLARRLQRQQPAGRPGGERRGIGMSDGRRQLYLQHAVIARDRNPAIVGRGGEDREDGPAHSPGTHPREIEIPPAPPGRDQVVVLLGEGIVVTIEYGDHGSNLASAART